MLGAAREHLRPLSAVVAWPFLALRVPPTLITVLALVPAGVAAGYLAQANWAAGLLWGAAGGFMDLADGAVARATKRVTRFGGYLDSVLDRVVDLLFLFGIGLGLDHRLGWSLVFLAAVFGYGTSYAKARAYEDVRAPPDTWNQFFERPERLIVLGLGVFGEAIALHKGWSYPVLLVALGICAGGSFIAFLQRIAIVRALLR